MKASHEEKWVPIKTGKGETIVHLMPGQFIFGRKSASKKLRMKPSSVRNRIEKLKNIGNLDTQPNTHFSIITVLNWDVYNTQFVKVDTEKDNQRTTKGQPKDTKKNYKNNKNIKKKNNKKKKDFIHPYLGEFKNVKLTQSEFDKLDKKFVDAIERIETLSVYLKSKGDKYKSHYATILNWDRMERKRHGEKIKPKTYAQAQDAERRGIAKWLKGKPDGNQRDGGEGNSKNVPLLPDNKT